MQRARWILNATALVVTIFLAQTTANGVAAEGKEKPKADPAASKLLAEARANRALWENFSGFTADIEVNLDGQISKGHVHVDAKGKARYDQLSQPAETWVKPLFASILSHRLDSGDPDTACTFADQDTHHPLGRAVDTLEDRMGSRYRIRDKQIMVVDRQMEHGRFIITVLENYINPEGKYLPTSYVINFWDVAGGALLKTEGHLQTWKRIGRFDLPVRAQVVIGAKAGSSLQAPQMAKDVYSTKSVTLSNHKLLEVVAN